MNVAASISRERQHTSNMKAKNAHSDRLYHYQGYECLTALAGIQYVDRVEEQKGANVQYMCQQLGNEVERQGKANKSTTPRTALSFQGKKKELAWVGFEPMTLCFPSLLRKWYVKNALKMNS